MLSRWKIIVNGYIGDALKNKIMSNKEIKYTFTEMEFVKILEWTRVNGERHRGNLQKNGIELYTQYLKEQDENRKYYTDNIPNRDSPILRD